MTNKEIIEVNEINYNTITFELIETIIQEVQTLLKKIIKKYNPQIFAKYAPDFKTFLEFKKVTADNFISKDFIDFLNLANIFCNLFIEGGYWNESEKILQEVINLLKQNQDFYKSSAGILILTTLGNLYVKQKDYQNAKDYLRQGLSFTEDIDNQYIKFKMNYDTGLCYSRSGDDNLGMEFVREAKEHSENITEPLLKKEAEAQISNQFGFIAYKKRDFITANSYYEKTFSLLEKEKNSPILAEALRVSGMLSAENQEFSYGEKLLQQSLKIYEDSFYNFEAALTKKNLGMFFMRKGELEEADFYITQSIEQLEFLSIDAELPILYSYKAKIALQKENITLAENLLKKSLKITQTVKNEHSLAFCFYYLGELHHFQKRHFVAESFFKRALLLFDKVGNKLYAGYCYLEMAIASSMQGAYHLAIQQAMKGEDLIKQHGTFYDMYKVHLAYGCIRREISGKESLAKQHFTEVVKILEEQAPSSIELAEAHYEFAVYYEKIGFIEKAVDHLRISLNLTEELGLTKKANRYLAKISSMDLQAAAKIRLKTLGLPKDGDGDKSQWMDFSNKNLTIIFVDICNFTPMTEKLPLDVISLLLNDFYINMTKIILKNDGFVDKFIGDCVMALFNIQGNQPDHSDKAVICAQEMIEEINKINVRRKANNQPTFKVAVGINSGEVILGSFGTALRRDFTAIGDSVNIAARIQAEATDNEILISEVTKNLLKEKFSLQSLGEKVVKGKTQAVTLWKVLKKEN